MQRMFRSFAKNVKERENATCFCKERKRTQRMFRSFAKNVKECENVSFFCKRTQNVAFFFQYIHIDVYRYTYIDIYRDRSGYEIREYSNKSVCVLIRVTV